jgi:hypothetical protein
MVAPLVSVVAVPVAAGSAARMHVAFGITKDRRPRVVGCASESSCRRRGFCVILVRK